MQLINNILHLLDFLGGGRYKGEAQVGNVLWEAGTNAESFSSYNMGAEIKYFLWCCNRNQVIAAVWILKDIRSSAWYQLYPFGEFVIFCVCSE